MEPVRIVRNFQRTSGFKEGDPYVYIEYEVPDMYGRPWAQIWEKYWEQGMEKPDGEDIFNVEN